MVGKCILSHWVGIVSMLFIYTSIGKESWYLKSEGVGIAILLQFVFWVWIIINSWEMKVYKSNDKLGHKIP